MRHVVLATALLGVSSGVCSAQIDYVTTSRTVAGRNQPITYNLAGPWQIETGTFEESIWGGGGARQTSDLGASAITGHLYAVGIDGNSGYHGNGSSLILSTFTLASELPCQISGTWQCSDPWTSTTSATIQLTGPNGVVYNGGGAPTTHPDPQPRSGTMSYAGLLQPGTYTLDVRVLAASGMYSGGSSMTFAMTIVQTCGTADFNCDGDTGTDADIEQFFACLAGDCSRTCYSGGADFDGDGNPGTDQDIEAFFRVLAGNPC